MFNWFGNPGSREYENRQGTHQSADGQKDLVDKGRYHGRPIRMYSDGSVKAATRDGWVRFRSFDEFKRHFHLK